MIRRRRLEGVGLAAGHDGQDAGLGTGLSAGNRRIDAANADHLAGVEQLSRHVGRGRRVIDERRAALHGAEHAVRPARDLPQVLVVAHAREHEIRRPPRLRPASRAVRPP